MWRAEWSDLYRGRDHWEWLGRYIWEGRRDEHCGDEWSHLTICSICALDVHAEADLVRNATYAELVRKWLATWTIEEGQFLDAFSLFTIWHRVIGLETNCRDLAPEVRQNDPLLEDRFGRLYEAEEPGTPVYNITRSSLVSNASAFLILFLEQLCILFICRLLPG